MLLFLTLLIPLQFTFTLKTNFVANYKKEKFLRKRVVFSKYKKIFSYTSTDAFGTLPNIYDGALKSELKSVNHFPKDKF